MVSPQWLKGGANLIMYDNDKMTSDTTNDFKLINHDTDKWHNEG